MSQFQEMLKFFKQKFVTIDIKSQLDWVLIIC